MSAPEPADLDISTRRPSPWRNLSFVWLVPVLALAISLGVAWQNYSNRGVLIEITFLNAAGVTPGETNIRFREVVIGTVIDTGFTEDLKRVVVTARMDKEVAPYLDESAAFWVVRPEVTTRGITGLSTVLSGVYIEAIWDDEISEPLRSFEALVNPPLVRPGFEGTRITLRTNDGTLVGGGAPITFRGIEVGRLETPRLTISGDSIVVDAFIEAPHDRRLTTATRFWDTSGFTVSFGSGGFALDVESIASLVAGGLGFDEIYQGGRPVGEGYIYDIYEDESQARQSAFIRSAANAVSMSVSFGDSISGLTAGAPVRLGGLRIGEVSAIAAEITETPRGPEIGLVANIDIEPSLLGLPIDAGEDETFDFFEEAVANGLRAKLGTTSIFSASLVVDLVTLDDVEPATFDRTGDPLPSLPSVESQLPDFTATAEGFLERINELPIEEMIEKAITLMDSFEDLARSEDTVAVPGAVVALMEDARSLVNDEETKALPGELRAAITELRTVVSDLREGGALKNLAEALESANATMTNVATASEQFPVLMEDLRSLAAKANSLEAEELIASATKLMDSADALIGTDEARALPPTLSAALEEIRIMLSELRAGGVVENANATMASAREAADAAAEATKSLPALTERLEGLAARAEGLVGAYGPRSDFNDQTLSVLREMRNAARSIAELARTIERNPNSLLLGK